ncbi:MAG TPA: immunoglobulin domain-containing protein [Prosthecobacter sp.]|nr:immunoglobulin domain-containing protein [Prosthecobacter sp.]
MAQVFIVNAAPAQVLAVGGKSQVLTFNPPGAAITHSYQWYKKVGAVSTPLTNGPEYTGVTTAALTVVTPDAADAIDYFCRVTAYGDTDDAGLRSMIVIPAPASTTVAAGETAELTVLPAGADQDTIDLMTFQWKKGATVLAGQTNQTLRLENADSVNTPGDYVCVVSLAGVGSVTSPPGKIVVVESALTRRLFLEGATADLSVNATLDAAQTYQWYRVGDGGPDVTIANGGKYSGATTKKLVIRPAAVADAGDYYCKVTSFGVTANSGIRTLVVVPTPLSRTVLSGSPLELSTMPAGAPLGDFTFQWKKGTTVLDGETSNVYLDSSAALADAVSYTCVVTLTGVGTVTTGLAKVVVVDSAPFTRLAVTGALSSPTLMTTLAGIGSTFQWYRVVDGVLDEPLGEGSEYSGVTTKTLTIKAASDVDAGTYRCLVTTFGETVHTADATLVLLPPPDSKLVPINSPVALQLFPKGASPVMTSDMGFQWKKASNLPGETASTLSFASAQPVDNGAYACIVTLPGALPSTLTSLPVKLNVVNTVAATKLALAGTSPTFETPVFGTGQTYQWYKVEGSEETLLPEGTEYGGTTTKTLTVKAVTLADGGSYVCRVSAFGQIVDGGSHRLVVISAPPSMLVDRGDNVDLEVMATGQPAPLTYQWFKAAASLTGETNATLEIDNIQIGHAGDYSCLVTLAGVGSLTTPATKVSVVDHTEAVALGVKGKDAKLTLGTAGTGQTFKWYRASNPAVYLADGADYAGATTKVLTVKLCDDADAGEYVCEVTAFGRIVAIGERTLEVVTSPVSTLVAVGTPLNLQVGSTGTISPLTYQWKKVTTALAGETGAVYQVASATLNEAADFSCVVGGGGATAVTTNVAKVAVADLAARTVAVNQTKIATLPAITKGLNITYEWYRLVEGVETPLSGAKYTGVLTNALKISDCQIGDAGEYVCKITANGITLTTGAVTLNVHRAPVLQTINLPTGIVGRSYSYQIPVDPDPFRRPKSYTASPLPSGLVLNSTTGVISGKPTVAVTNQSVNISAINDVGTSSAVAPITINAMPSYLVGSYAGPIERSATLNAGLGGALELAVASTGAASGKILMGTASYSFAGSVELDSIDSATATATATITVARMGFAPLTMTFSIGTVNLLTGGVITDGTNSVNFHGWRNKFSAGNSTTAYAGLHNFGMGLPLLDGDIGNPGVPQGVGFGTFTVSNAGAFSIVGNMADGEAVTFATFIGPNGEFFIFKPLYATVKGSVLAELDLDDKGTVGTEDNSLSGTGTWVRPANAVSTQPRVYSAGFGPVNLAFEGGRYVPPSLVLGVTAGPNNATLTFEEAEISAARLNPDVNISIQTGNVVTISAPNEASLKFAATSTAASMTSSGLFKGDFTLLDDDATTGGVNPNEVSRICPFSGIIYPKNGVLVGAGYVSVAQKPSVGPPATTKDNSPILFGGAYFERKP